MAKLSTRSSSLIIIAAGYLAVFACVLFISLRTIKMQRAEGIVPSFYQSYYEPAVRIACGQGFGVDPTGRITPELRDFLQLKRDAVMPEDVPLPEKMETHPNTRVWYHLFWTVGMVWRITGISWHVVDGIAASLLSLAAVFTLALFRLWMPLGAAAPLAVLSTLPGLPFLLFLRDLNKAPFIIAALFAAGLAATRELTLRRLLALSGGLGLLLGVGYGFRPDVLIGLPIMAVAVLFFRPVPWRKRLAGGALAVALMLGAFSAAASPVFSTFSKEVGSCSWHFSLLGLSDTHNTQLGQTLNNYSWLTHYDDLMLARTVDSYAKRNLDASPVGYCTAAYDLASRLLYFDILRTFPADFSARMVAAAKQVLSCGLWGQPRSFFTTQTGIFLQQNRSVLQNMVQIGWILALLLILARNLRLGLFALFSFIYLSTYPVIQFDLRHYFHLGFLTWLPAGLLVSTLSREALARWAMRPGPFVGMGLRDFARGALVLAATTGLLFALYAGLSLRQKKNLDALLARYAVAGGDPAGLLDAPAASVPKTQLASAPRARWVITNPLGARPGLYDRMLRLDFELGTSKPGPRMLIASLSAGDGTASFEKKFTFELSTLRPRATVFLPIYFEAPHINELTLSLAEADRERLVSARFLRSKELPSLWLAITAYQGQQDSALHIATPGIP